MLTVHQTPSITLTTKCSRDIEADLLILPVFEDDPVKDETDLDSASGGELSAALARREVTGKAYDLFFTAVRGWKSPRVLLVGAGPRGEFTADRVALIHRGGTSVTPEQAAQVLAEGAVLSNFDGASYKTGDTRRVWLSAVQVRVGASGQAASPAVEAAIQRGSVLGECTNLARTLSNEPSNTLTPRVFADRAQALAKDAGLSAEIFDEKRIADLRMGLLLGVARQRRAAAHRHPPPRAEERS
jgi:leucyl aminopeptidase